MKNSALKIEYGFTRAGQHYEHKKIGSLGLIKVTRAVLFCNLLASAIQEAKEESERRVRVMRCISFWTFGGPEHLRGNFDHEHYEKVLAARAEYVHECATCGDKFRPGNGVEILGFKFCHVCTETDEHAKYILEAPSAKDNLSLLYDLINNPKQI